MIYAEKEKAVDHVVPVDVQLEESKPKRLRMGIGYETDTGPKGTFKYEDVNFRKTGHRFEAQFDFSAPLVNAGVRYIMPHPKDIRSFSTLSFNAKREDYRNVPDYLGNAIPNYFNETLTAEYERARSFGKAGTGSVFLQLLKEDSDVGDDHTNTFSVLPGFPVVCHRLRQHGPASAGAPVPSRVKGNASGDRVIDGIHPVYRRRGHHHSSSRQVCAPHAGEDRGDRAK